MTRAADLAKLIAGGGTITVADNSTNITLKSTDDDANDGPLLDLTRDSASPADNDTMGSIRFRADDDGGNEQQFVDFRVVATDVTNGNEDAKLTIRTIAAGTLTDTLVLESGATTVSGTLASTGVLTANAGVVVDNITIDGTQIDLSSGNLEIDSAGDITLDSDTGAWRFKDNEVSVFQIARDGDTSVNLFNARNNSDIIFKGTDDNNTITALTLDMADAGHATFNNGITLSDGNLKLADTHGIDFSSTSDAGGMANELLDDYEEGTWTPFFGGSSGDPTVSSYSTANGKYTKVGNKVYANFVCIASGTPSGGSGDLLIAGLPFALNATNTQATGYLGIVNNITNNMSTSQLMLVGQSTSTNINVMNCAGTSTTSTNNLGVSSCHNSGARIDGTFIYTVTA